MKHLSALAILVAFAWVLLPNPGPVSAHATLVSSEPSANDFLQRSPDVVILNFTEPLARSSSSVRVLDAGGHAIEVGPVSFTNNNLSMRTTLPRLAPGIYNVVWENVSTVDGHGLRGSFPFTVLNADGSVPDAVNAVSQIGGSDDPVPLADASAVRLLALLGLLIAAGGALMLLLWDPPLTAPGPGLTRVILLGGGVALIAAMLNLAVIEREYVGLGLGEVMFQTRIGGYWLMRLGAALVILMLAAFVREAPRWAAAGVVAAVGVYLLAFTATSHAAAGAGSGWAMAIDFGHAVAAVAWIGAVIGLAVTLRLTGKGAKPERLLPRFSVLASVMVFVVLATGLLNSLIEVDRPGALGDTRYGVTLLAKLGLMLLLLVVALYNATRGRRRLFRGMEGRRWFRGTVIAEIFLGIAVFSVAAVLTQTTASKSVIREPDSRAYSERTELDDIAVGLDVDPNRTGVNTFRVGLSDGNGEPIVADHVRLTFRYQQDSSVGPSALNLTRASSPGTFIGQGPFLPLEGQWRVEVLARVPDADDTIVFFDVRPAGRAVLSRQTGGTWSNPSLRLTWNQFGGIVVLMGGLGFALFRGRLNLLGRWPGAGANAATVVGFGVGTLLVFGVHGHEPAQLPENPIFPDRESIARGRALYQQNCVLCHGSTGVPPAGLDLNPYPLDLTVHVPQHPDGEVFNFIKDGVPGTTMIAWGDEGGLSDEEVWHLVNYLRTLRTVTE